MLEEPYISNILSEKLKQKLNKYADERVKYELSYLDSYLMDCSCDEDEQEKIRNWVKDHLRLSCVRAYEQAILDCMDYLNIEKIKN